MYDTDVNVELLRDIWTRPDGIGYLVHFPEAQFWPAGTVVKATMLEDRVILHLRVPTPCSSEFVRQTTKPCTNLQRLYGYMSLFDV